MAGWNDLPAEIQQQIWHSCIDWKTLYNGATVPIDESPSDSSPLDQYVKLLKVAQVCSTSMQIIYGDLQILQADLWTVNGVDMSPWGRQCLQNALLYLKRWSSICCGNSMPKFYAWRRQVGLARCDLMNLEFIDPLWLKEHIDGDADGYTYY